MTTRLIFGLFFFVGTLAAAAGWLLPMLGKPVELLAIFGHLAQIIALIVLIVIPDEVEEHEDDSETMV